MLIIWNWPPSSRNPWFSGGITCVVLQHVRNYPYSPVKLSSWLNARNKHEDDLEWFRVKWEWNRTVTTWSTAVVSWCTPSRCQVNQHAEDPGLQCWRTLLSVDVFTLQCCNPWLQNEFISNLVGPMYSSLPLLYALRDRVQCLSSTIQLTSLTLWFCQLAAFYPVSTGFLIRVKLALHGWG